MQVAEAGSELPEVEEAVVPSVTGDDCRPTGQFGTGGGTLPFTIPGGVCALFLFLLFLLFLLVLLFLFHLIHLLLRFPLLRRLISQLDLGLNILRRWKELEVELPRHFSFNSIGRKKENPQGKQLAGPLPSAQ